MKNKIIDTILTALTWSLVFISVSTLLVVICTLLDLFDKYLKAIL